MTGWDGLTSPLVSRLLVVTRVVPLLTTLHLLLLVLHLPLLLPPSLLALLRFQDSPLRVSILC